MYSVICAQMLENVTQISLSLQVLNGVKPTFLQLRKRAWQACCASLSGLGGEQCKQEGNVEPGEVSTASPGHSQPWAEAEALWF